MRRKLLATSLALAFSALPLAASAAPAYVLSGTQIFAGPGDDYPVVAQLGPGVNVNVNGCISDYSWCDVSLGGNRGWVYAADLGYQYRNGRVPIMEYGPSLALPIISFSLGDYWGRYYHNRPFYHERNTWERRWHEHGDYGMRGRQEWHGNQHGNDRNDYRGNQYRGNEYRGNDRGNNYRENRSVDTDRSDRGTQQYGPNIRDQARGEARPDLPRGNGQPHAIGPDNPNYHGGQQ